MPSSALRAVAVVDTADVLLRQYQQMPFLLAARFVGKVVCRLEALLLSLLVSMHALHSIFFHHDAARCKYFLLRGWLSSGHISPTVMIGWSPSARLFLAQHFTRSRQVFSHR